MARIIPNEETYVAFAASIAKKNAPTVAEVAAAVNLTPYIISINASTRGNVVQTPSFDTKFETSIPGTVTATFEADLYRDDEDDDAWITLPRDTRGFFLIKRFGGTGGPSTTPALALHAPFTGDDLEVWPVFVVARTATNLTSNTSQTFSLQCSVPEEPAEDAIVVAA
jgi:hypothetical protein